MTVESRRAAAPPMVLAATLGLVPLALALIGLGFVIVFAPSLVPALTPRLFLPERNSPGGQ